MNDTQILAYESRVAMLTEMIDTFIEATTVVGDDVPKNVSEMFANLVEIANDMKMEKWRPDIALGLPSPEQEALTVYSDVIATQKNKIENLERTIRRNNNPWVPHINGFLKYRQKSRYV